MRARAGTAVATLVVLLLGAPAAGQQPPTGSLDALPLACVAADAVQYVVPPALDPVRSSFEDAAPTRLLLRGTVVTMDDAHHVVRDGNVLVTGEMITAVWSGPTPPAGVDVSGATVVDAGRDALIFPGLINLHDHPSYDVLPLWPAPSSHRQGSLGRPTGTEPYANRYQWNRPDRSSPQHSRLIKNPQSILTSSDALGLYVEVLKHAEARAILGGQTALQGVSQEPAVQGLLVRNVDGTNFGRDRIEARVPDVGAEDFPPEAAALAERMRDGQVDAWLVHLAEGVRDGRRRPGDTESSRQELDLIRQLGLLTDATVVLHGVGLERSDFAAMRRARRAGRGDGLGAKLVWSPLSNLLLYGRNDPGLRRDRRKRHGLPRHRLDPERVEHPARRAEGGRHHPAEPSASRRITRTGSGAAA